MKGLSALFVTLLTPIKDAIRVIDQGAAQIALVVDSQQRLLGVITDGDIRRGILRGVRMDETVDHVMLREFRSVSEHVSSEEVLALMGAESLHQVPVLDTDGCVLGLHLLDDLIKPTVISNLVILMAGGEGRRLLPVTATQPKPMVSVGGKPILEILVERCRSAGLLDIFISVNHLKQQIMEHFGDGSLWNLQVRYLEEEEPLGTAGPLGLLPVRPDEPIVVINGDVLSRVDLPGLLRFHREHEAAATLCVSAYETHIPFGVVQVDGVHMRSFEEKPVLTHFVNAGVYVLNPELLDFLPVGEPFDMPELLASAGSSGLDVAVFPIHEYWLDVGTPSALDQAKGDWP